MQTLTGMDFEAVEKRMTAHLEAGAYKAVGGAEYLTDINPAYLREALTDCFGLCGFGWTFKYDPEDLVIAAGDRPLAYLTYSELRFAYKDGDEIRWSEPIIGMGGSDNRKIGDAIKGAVTQSLGKAASMLLWQIDVYKGVLDHRNAGQSGQEGKNEAQGASGGQERGESGQSGGSQGSERHKRSGGPLDPDRIRSVLQTKVGEIGEYDASDKFRGFVRGMMNQIFPDDKDPNDKVHSLLAYLFGVTSSTDLTGAQVKALRDWLDTAKIEDKIVVNPIVIREGQAIYQEHLKASGQKELPDGSEF